MENFQFEDTSGQWKLLFVWSMAWVKAAVSLRNGNKFPSVPLVQAVRMKETHVYRQVFLQKIRYYEHQWNICADLKVIALLTAQKGGYTKFCCF
jgi:hypothetical protein